MLPLSFASERAALSTGATADQCAGSPCKAGSTVVQFIAALEGYTAQAPATLIFRCDKTQCGNGGVNKFKVYYTYLSSGPLDTVAPACLLKGQANVDPVTGSRWPASTTSTASATMPGTRSSTSTSPTTCEAAGSDGLCPRRYCSNWTDSNGAGSPMTPRR